MGSDQWTMINGAFIKKENSFLHISDLSIQRGYGIFDFMKVIDFQPVFIQDHLERFYYSAGEMHLTPPYEKEILSEHIINLIKKNNMKNGGVRLTLTGGNSPDGYALSNPNMIISSGAFQTPAKEKFEKGIELMSFQHQRQLPAVKTINYMMAIWLQPMISKYGAEDVLYYDNGLYTECPRSNFFLVLPDDTIVTPDSAILKGITRMKLLIIAGEHYQVEERPVTIHDILTATEAFMTSTTKVLLPIARIDDKFFDVPGIITKKLYQSFLLFQEKQVDAYNS